jgi:hypothetical protein
MLVLGWAVLMGERCLHHLAARQAASLPDPSARPFVTRCELIETPLGLREQLDEIIGLGVEYGFVSVHAEVVGLAFVNFR